MFQKGTVSSKQQMVKAKHWTIHSHFNQEPLPFSKSHDQMGPSEWSQAKHIQMQIFFSGC